MLQSPPQGSTLSLLVHSKKKNWLLICVVFSKVFHILVNLCAFVQYACEDTASLKFGGLLLIACDLYMCLCLCGVKLCYLLFVYGFEYLMKIN